MTRTPANFTEQQLTLRLQKPQGVLAIVPARTLVGGQQFITQLPRPADHKHHSAARAKRGKRAIGNSDFRLTDMKATEIDD